METVRNNRYIQRTHSTYKNKSDISEALHLIKSYINESTYKFLSHFLHTGGSGVTQAKITEICKIAGISTGVYSKVVKNEIERTFEQPLIIKTPAPMKYDSKHKKKVKASDFKSLLPLSIIKKLVVKKYAEDQRQLEEYWEQFNIVGDSDGDIESVSPIHCESKDESTFPQEQNKSFRINLEINNKNLVNKRGVNNHEKMMDDLILEYMKKGLDKKVCFMVISEIMPNGQAPKHITNIGGYIRMSLERTLYNSQLKRGLITPKVDQYIDKLIARQNIC